MININDIKAKNHSTKSSILSLKEIELDSKIEDISHKDNDEIIKLVILAKNGNKNAKEKLISKYYGFVVYQAKNIYLNGYTFDDLVQIGIESILESINKFDINKKTSTFNSYVFGSIRNNFSYLCRKENKYNEVFSLNTVFVDDMETIDLVLSPDNIEEVILETITSKELLLKLQLLDKEELCLIKFLYLDDDIQGANLHDSLKYNFQDAKSLNYDLQNNRLNKRFLSDYAKLKGKDYYYCVNIKKRAFRKLKK